ncbi:MAG: Crp/Fnr family transcriptional regulator [Spirochaetia bacterium]|jgi:CRP-like cAMP-binding protein|nr:Crp/Fnr family transcriptional regulator [Spirochaetia bacterium]
MDFFSAYRPILMSCELFKGIQEKELRMLLQCLDTVSVRFEKNTTVLLCGKHIEQFGLVLSGQVQIFQEDYYGNKSILAQFDTGNIFAESFAFAGIPEIPVTAWATEESIILFINSSRLLSSCRHACTFHTKLIQNMMTIIARKNILLTQKIECTSKKTIKAKLLAYLSLQAQIAKGNHFRIPFNRQELADFLAVDRSAMSAVLSKMADDGTIRFHKNEFELLEQS